MDPGKEGPTDDEEMRPSEAGGQDHEEEEMEEEQVLVRSQSLMEFRSSSRFIEAVKTAKRLFWAKTINPMVVVRPPNFRASRVRFSNIK